MLADDSSLSASGNNIAATNTKLQISIQEVTEWRFANALLLNPEKTKSMAVATQQKHQCGLPHLRLMLNSQIIEQVSEHRHLGVVLDDQLKWQICICSLASDTFVTVKFEIRFFHAHIMSRINYVCRDVHWVTDFDFFSSSSLQG